MGCLPRYIICTRMFWRERKKRRECRLSKKKIFLHLMQFVPTFNFSFAILIIKYSQSYISYSKSSYLMKISNSNSARFFSFSLLSFKIELTTTFTLDRYEETGIFLLFLREIKRGKRGRKRRELGRCREFSLDLVVLRAT